MTAADSKELPGGCLDRSPGLPCQIIGVDPSAGHAFGLLSLFHISTKILVAQSYFLTAAGDSHGGRIPRQLRGFLDRSPRLFRQIIGVDPSAGHAFGLLPMFQSQLKFWSRNHIFRPRRQNPSPIKGMFGSQPQAALPNYWRCTCVWFGPDVSDLNQIFGRAVIFFVRDWQFPRRQNPRPINWHAHDFAGRMHAQSKLHQIFFLR